MKTEEELNALKEEVEALNKKLAELSKEELEQVTGGITNLFRTADANTDFKIPFKVPENDEIYNYHFYK